MNGTFPTDGLGGEQNLSGETAETLIASLTKELELERQYNKNLRAEIETKNEQMRERDMQEAEAQPGVGTIDFS